MARVRAAIGALPGWVDPNTGEKGSGQGVYACTPDGDLLGWMSPGGSSLGEGLSYANANDVVRVMTDALEKWDQLRAAAEAAAEAPPAEAAEGEAAEGGQRDTPVERGFLAERFAGHAFVLRVTARDLPRRADAPGQKTKWGDEEYRQEWNLNYAGFTADEARQFLPPDPTPGAEHEVPAELVRRLACDYLIDNAHGTAPRFRPEDVREARLTARVVTVDDGGLVSVRLEGHTRTAGGAFGFDAKILGRAAYRRDGGQWVGFELVAVGSRRGAVHHSGRGPWGGTPVDEGPAPLGVVCTLVERDAD